MSQGTAIYEFGPFHVNPATREIRKDGELLQVPAKVFDLLHLLLTHSDRVLEHQDLMRLLWPRSVVSKGALPQTTLKLRKLLGGEAESQQWIATVRGIGYRFVGQVSRSRVAPIVAGLRPEAAPSRGSAMADLGARAVAVHRLAREQIIRSDYDAYVRTTARLADRSEFGLDLRARVLALLGQYVQHLREGYAKAWHTLQRAEQLMASLDCPIVKLLALQAKGVYFGQFVSESEALPFLASAMDAAVEQPDLLYASESAFLLAAAFSRIGDDPACVKWGSDAIAYASRVEPPFIRTATLIMVAGTRVRLGEKALELGDSTKAAKHFGSAVQLLDDAEADGDAETLRLMSTYLQVNRAFAEANLDPASRARSIETYRVLLGQVHRPVVRLDCMLDMGRLLRDAGRLEEADETCQQALDLATTSGIVRVRESILLLAADVAKRKGRLGAAVLRLHELLAYQKAAALLQAATVAKVTALRMETENALAIARTELAVARQLREENERLRAQVAMRDMQLGEVVPHGELPPDAFWAFIGASQAKARREGRPCWIAVITPRQTSDHRWAGAACCSVSGQWKASEHIATCVRSTDRWTVVETQFAVLALPSEDAALVKLAAVRLQSDLPALSASRGLQGTEVHVAVLDLADSQSDEHPLGRIRAALQRALEN